MTVIIGVCQFDVQLVITDIKTISVSYPLRNVSFVSTRSLLFLEAANHTLTNVETVARREYTSIISFRLENVDIIPAVTRTAPTPVDMYFTIALYAIEQEGMTTIYLIATAVENRLLGFHFFAYHLHPFCIGIEVALQTADSQRVISEVFGKSLGSIPFNRTTNFSLIIHATGSTSITHQFCYSIIRVTSRT